MHPSIASELIFKTSRSGGAGGQNVNKVETAVEGSWQLATSQLFNDDQKALLQEKLAAKMNKEGMVLVRSQVHRSQLANKEEVIKKFDKLVHKALLVKKARKVTKPSRESKEKRLESKKMQAQKKENRKPIS